MSRLEILNRPPQVFDPSVPEHRHHYYQSLINNGWSQCPVRFVILDDQGDLTTMIQRKLARYYAEQEFGGKSS
jgi:hypothetical protein